MNDGNFSVLDMVDEYAAENDIDPSEVFAQPVEEVEKPKKKEG